MVDPVAVVGDKLSAWAGAIKYLLYFLGGGLLLVIIGFWYRNKRIFIFPVGVYRRRGNERKIRVCKGGYINKNKMRTFRIKWGRINAPWNRKDLDFLPDTNHMDSEGRIYFDQLDPDTYIQTRKFHLKRPTRIRRIKLLENYGELKVGAEITQYEHLIEHLVNSGTAEYSDLPTEEEYKEVEEIYFEPVPRDTKALAVQEIKNVNQALGRDSLKTTLIIGGLMVLGVVLIVTIFILKG